MKRMEYKDYLVSSTLKDQLEKDGIAVVPSVISEEECIVLRNKVWQEISHITKDRFQIEDKNTWKSFYDMFPLHSMLLQHWGVGHMQPVWDIRQHQNVIKIFEELWSTDDLLVSFDGISIHLPPEVTRRGWHRNNIWMHTDQSSTKKGLHCIQGQVNLYPVNEGDATLAVLEGSHKYHEDFFKDNEIIEKNDWYKLKDNELEYFTEKGCQTKCIKADIGSITLWDSRTFHQGIEPQKTRENANFRMTVYVCMTPRNKCSKANLKKKIKAFEELRMTTHWPSNPKLFPLKPRTYGKILPEFNIINPPVLTEIGRKLIGY